MIRPIKKKTNEISISKKELFKFEGILKSEFKDTSSNVDDLIYGK